MTRTQLELCLKRFGIDINTMSKDAVIAKMNHAIYQIALDNPENVYPLSRQNGVYDIDWENEMLIVREYRQGTTRGYGSNYPIELEVGFDMIQKIRFYLSPEDWKNNDLTNSTLDSIFDKDEV